jgi:hypothetical protein
LFLEVVENTTKKYHKTPPKTPHWTSHLWPCIFKVVRHLTKKTPPSNKKYYVFVAMRVKDI